MIQKVTAARALGLALAIALATGAGPVAADDVSFDSTQAPSLMPNADGWR